MNFDMSNHTLHRFRSAPSSVLEGFVNDIERNRDYNDALNYNLQDLQDEVEHKPNLTSNLSTSMAIGVGDLGQQSRMESNLCRQNSSPAGVFSNLNLPNGYGGTRGTPESYRFRNVGNTGELRTSSNRLTRQISCSTGFNSSGILPRIPETEPDTSDSGVLNESSNYPFVSWEHDSTSHFIDNFTGLKRELDLPNGNNAGNRPPMLSHHLSLPKTYGEMGTAEKLLHFQDSVPFKIRAKRGCATHPRSIAERVRKTRISERMRKLQELVPHMDKQTNTSDMLDLAVDYIKDLQEQYKVLKDCRANCGCTAK